MIGLSSEPDVLGAEATGDPPSATPSLSRASSPIETSRLSTLDSEEPSFYAARKTDLRAKYGEYWNRMAPCPSPEPEYDHFADFEKWLATTDSIEFIG